MSILSYISNGIIPVIVFAIIAVGISKKQNVYDDFLTGARQGLKIVIEIIPTIVGLMIAVGVLRASGFIDGISVLIQNLIRSKNFPDEIIPLAIIKMFSSSAATGFLIDIYKQYGTDSKIGLIGSIMLSSTETIFYTMSVYYMTVKVKKTRWTLPGALISSLAGIMASILIVKFM